MSLEERCKYFDICGLPPRGPNPTCVLHEANNKRDESAFMETFKNLLEKGHSNYQKMYFPENQTIFKDRTFSEDLDFTDANFEGPLHLQNLTLKKKLKISSGSLTKITLKDIHVGEEVEIKYTANKEPLEIDVLGDSSFRRDVLIESALMGVISFGHSKFESKLTIKANNLKRMSFLESKILSLFDIQNCCIESELRLNDVSFGQKSEVNLCSSRFRKGIQMGGKTNPEILRINAIKVEGRSKLACSMNSTLPMKIIAETIVPKFDWHEIVRFENVDLSECLLLGNNLKNFEFINVRWAKLGSRSGLKDEKILHEQKEKNKTLVQNLRESYEFLKKEYEAKGNHLQSGLFHYGEMEMRRREYGFPKRYFGLEAFYWLLSGYGIGWGRALLWVVLATFIPAGIYWCDNCGKTPYEFLDWLRHSFQVTTFQKPNLPAMENAVYSNLTKWTQAIQSVLGPFQIALFVLAVRTRIKR